jgi:hypothetical protein
LSLAGTNNLTGGDRSALQLDPTRPITPPNRSMTWRVNVC